MYKSESCPKSIGIQNDFGEFKEFLHRPITEYWLKKFKQKKIPHSLSV